MQSGISHSPRVSIVTPSFNQAQFLEETMVSVLNQDYAGIEYIVMDGGSTDGSVDIIRNYADRLAFWTSEPDRGQADAINKGLRRATGAIVAWLNSDDVYFTRDAVRKMVQAFQNHPEADVIYGDAATIDEDGYIRRIRRLPDYDAGLLFRTSYLVQPAVFLRSKAIAHCQCDASLNLGMDYKLWLALAREFRFAHFPYVIAGDRNHLRRKTVSSRPAAETMEQALLREMGAPFGFRRSVLRFFDKAFAMGRRFLAIPDMLSLYHHSDWAFHAHLQSKPAALWDQIFGKDYQKL